MPRQDRQGPERTCVACGKRSPQAELLRLALNGAEVEPDPGRRLAGRGAYICRQARCVERLAKMGRRRDGVFRKPVQDEAWAKLLSRLRREISPAQNDLGSF